MNNVETYTLTVNDFGQKICVSQSDPNKRFILDSTALVRELNTTSSSTTLQSDNNTIMVESSNLATLLEPPQLEMISLDNTQDFEEQLIHELDSDMLSASDPDSHFQMLHMDIREPLSKLKKLLEQKLNMKLTNFVFTLQDTQSLEDHKNLVDQCVQGEGVVQVNVQVQFLAKKINIVDVLKPAKDYIHNENNITQEVQSDEDEIQVTDPLSRNKNEVEEICTENHQNIVQWQVDLQYKKEQERLKIPLDPEDWSVLHVRHWLQWAVRQFSLSNIKLTDWNMTGKELFKVTMKDFQKLVPNDPEDIFWTHLELLRKMKLIATLRNDPQKVAQQSTQRKALHKPKLKVIPNYGSTLITYNSPYTQSSSGNKSGNNGQIQLWQFLLELLTSRAHTSVIQWTGKEGEFKFTHPEVVAHLWGERKNKPAMNYEKLSRALRYYYDGDMISKVHGKRFVYKFVCDLKHLLGYSARELANLVKYGNPMIEIKD